MDVDFETPHSCGYETFDSCFIHSIPFLSMTWHQHLSTAVVVLMSNPHVYVTHTCAQPKRTTPLLLKERKKERKKEIKKERKTESHL